MCYKGKNKEKRGKSKNPMKNNSFNLSDLAIKQYIFKASKPIIQVVSTKL